MADSTKNRQVQQVTQRLRVDDFKESYEKAEEHGEKEATPEKPFKRSLMIDLENLKELKLRTLKLKISGNYLLRKR